MQIRSFEYLADDTTNSLNSAITGLVEAGAYRGFDDAEIVAGAISFTHNKTGFSYFDGVSIHENCSLIVTKKGCRIVETTQKQVPFTSHTVIDNVIFASTLVCSHERSESEGGQIATYFFISSSDTITSDMTVIGNIYEFSDGSIIWKKRQTALLGGRVIENETLQANAMWRDKEFEQVVSINNHGMAMITEGGNIFNIQGTDTIYSLPRFENEFRFSKRGAVIRLKCLEGFSISDEIPQNFYFQDNEKPIKILGSDTISFSVGGMVELVETETHWQVTNVWENNLNVAAIGFQLQNKQTWGYFDNFRQGLNYSLSKADECEAISGLIQNNGKNRFVEVTLMAGQEVSGFQEPFMYGLDVIVRFVIPTSTGTLRNSVGPTKFKTHNGLDGELKDGSVIRGIQTLDCFYVTDFEPIKETQTWVTPTLLGSGFEVLPINGNIKYCFFPDGTLRFVGSVKITGGGGQLYFEIPSEKFKEPAVKTKGFTNAVSVPPFELGFTKYNFMGYSEKGTLGQGVFVSSGYYTFILHLPQNDNITEIDFLLNGLSISYM